MKYSTLLGLATLSLYLVASPAIASVKRAEGTPLPFPTLTKGDRLTIVSPHPDDETIALGGLIYRARQLSVPVSVIFMTNGDSSIDGARRLGLNPAVPADMIELGKRRQTEALNALQALDVPASSVSFLSLPDGGLNHLLEKKYSSAPYTSPLTQLQNNSAYPRSFIAGLAYTGRAAHGALLKAINSTHPTKVFVTMREDTHPDHHAAGQFLEDVHSRLVGSPKRYAYLVHYPNYPEPTFGFPSSLKSRPWDIITLSKDEQARQTDALSKYVSQIESDSSKSFFAPFAGRNELVTE